MPSWVRDLSNLPCAAPLDACPRRMVPQRRLLRHIIQLTPSSRQPISVTGSLYRSARSTKARERANPNPYVQMSTRHNALTGASIVALGAGAFLCARAYSNSCSKSSTSATGTTSTTSLEALSAARSATKGPAESSEKKNSIGAQRAAETSPPKKPCGGCDCGLMEPGPLEGTMHAYERHIIICR